MTEQEQQSVLTVTLEATMIGFDKGISFGRSQPVLGLAEAAA